MRSNAHPKLSLLLTVAVAWLGCRDDLIQITLELRIPESVLFDQIEVVRIDERNEPIPQVDARLSGPEKGGTRPHTAGIFIPRGWSHVHWRGRALHLGMVVAEGDVTLDSPMASLPLRLYACRPSFPPTQVLGSCPAEEPAGSGGRPGQPAIGTGGVGGSPEAGAGGAAIDVASDGASNAGGDGPRGGSGTNFWTPRMCTIVDQEAMPPAPVVPQPVDPNCQTYCEAMQASCPFAYKDTDHCLLTCVKIAWPVTTEFTKADTLTCRIAWAQMAGRMTGPDRGVACYRASLTSGGACGNPCEVYCHAGNAICPGGYFPPDAQCPDACLRAERVYMNRLPAPTVTFEAALLACRMLMVQNAVFDPTWCTYAAPNACADSPCAGAVF
jgi:hypothetical protein